MSQSKPSGWVLPHASSSCRLPLFSPCRIMISPTDADGSFIAHNAMKGLPDQAEIIPDASKICLSTDREALSREERVVCRQTEENTSFSLHL